MTKRLPITLPESRWCDEYNDTQMKIFWLPDEVKVEKDVQDVLVTA
jgi:ribonucleotide reductase beta subunit family protein with ferritin-like domain